MKFEIEAERIRIKLRSSKKNKKHEIYKKPVNSLSNSYSMYYHDDVLYVQLKDRLVAFNFDEKRKMWTISSNQYQPN